MTVLEILFTVGATAFVLWFLPPFRNRYNGDSIRDLRHEVETLRTLLEYEREERIKAYRRIEELEKKEQQLQIIIAELQEQIGNAETKTVTVLGIWSGDNLDTIAERDAIYDAGIEYRPLFGDAATKANILRELRQGNIAIIEIGAHGDAEAIFVKGEELTAGWWHRALLGRDVRVAIILACFSDNSVADAFRRAGVPSVIAVSGEIEDKATVEFVQQFYQLYADGKPVKEAFDEARLAINYDQAEKLVLRTR